MVLHYGLSMGKIRILPLGGLRGLAVLLVIGFHLLIIDIVREALVKSLLQQKLATSDDRESVYGTMLSFKLTLGLAALSYRYIEQLIIESSHRFKYE